MKPLLRSIFLIAGLALGKYALASQLILFDMTGGGLECLIHGRSTNGVVTQLFVGGVGGPSLIELPAGLWPVPPGQLPGSSPDFEGLDLDCGFAGRMQPEPRFRKSLGTGSNFWVSDITGMSVFPSQNYGVILKFSEDVDEDSETEECTQVLKVSGESSRWPQSDDWQLGNWERFRFPKTIRGQ